MACPIRASLSCRGREDLVHHVKDYGLTLSAHACVSVGVDGVDSAHPSS